MCADCSIVDRFKSMGKPEQAALHDAALNLFLPSPRYREVGMTNIDRELFFSITSDYTPYDQFEEFHEGFLDFKHGLHHNPYDVLPGKDFEAQAWACGQEAAVRYVRAAGEHNTSASPSREHSVYTLRPRGVRHERHH